MVWADIILVMERKHKDILKLKFPSTYSNKTIVVLDIPDEYQFGDSELIELLKTKLENYL